MISWPIKKWLNTDHQLFTKQSNYFIVNNLVPCVLRYPLYWNHASRTLCPIHRFRWCGRSAVSRVATLITALQHPATYGCGWKSEKKQHQQSPPLKQKPELRQINELCCLQKQESELQTYPITSASGESGSSSWGSRASTPLLTIVSEESGLKTFELTS